MELSSLSSSSSTSTSTPVIRKLNESVINRIAAGEVVQKPAAAIKEMLENSIDARSTQINISIKGGGLALMQIQDNGHGIRKEDMPIVCERFTTSKLAEFDDLKKISTFGFRGEALASITYVSNVTITSKTADSQCAFKAKYLDGQLVPAKPGDSLLKPCAGVNGTTITVEDLFYNMPTRKQAFKNMSEQYQKVLDVVSKYSIHFAGRNVAFTCKKLDGKGLTSAPDLITPNNSSVLDNIKIIFGNSIAKELIDFEVDNCTFAPSSAASSSSSASSSSESAGRSEFENYMVGGVDRVESNDEAISDADVIFAIKGKISNANYANKKGYFILFINNRLVDSSSIRRVVDEVYNDILPRHSHPFVYLSLTMPSHHVDVNVHPTKKEVHFLYEERILLALHRALSENLKSSNDSRTFTTQTLMSSHLMDFNPSSSNNNNNSNSNSNSNKNSNSNSNNNNSNNNFSQRSNVDRWDDSENISHENEVIQSSNKVRNSSSFNDSSDSKEIMSSDNINNEFSDNIIDEGGAEDREADDDDDEVLDEAGTLQNKRYLHHDNSNSNSHSNSNKRSRSGANGSNGVNEASNHSHKQTLAPSKLVRVDPKVVRIDSIFLPKNSSFPRSNSNNSSSSNSKESGALEDADSEFADGFEGGSFCQVIGSSSSLSSSRSSRQKFMAPCACCASSTSSSLLCIAHNNASTTDGISSSSSSSSSAIAHLNQLGQRHSLSTFEDSICEYESITQLRTEMVQSRSVDIDNVLKNFSFVGAVDQSHAILQHKTKLLLVNVGQLLRLTIYQVTLRQFGSLPALTLQTKVNIRDYVRQALDDPSLIDGLDAYLISNSNSNSNNDNLSNNNSNSSSDNNSNSNIDSNNNSNNKSNSSSNSSSNGGLDSPADKETLADMVALLLREKSEMLNEYFAISIDPEGFLTQLPNVLNGLVLNPLGLPKFLLRLATEINWDNELACFHSISHEISLFFADLSLMEVNKSPNSAIYADYQAYVRDFIFPVVKMFLAPSKVILSEGWIVEIASLEDLYKTFERC